MTPNAGRAPRVLLVTARFTPDVGGIETHVAEVAPRLAALGFEVEVLTTDRTGTRPRQEIVDGVAVERVRAHPESRDYYLAPELPAAMRRFSPDLVHVQGYHTLVAPLAMAAAALTRVPYVVSFHSGGHPSALRNRARFLQRLALRPLFLGAARLIAVSEFERELFRSQLRLRRERFRVVRNGSSIRTPATRPDDDRPTVVSLGRLERYKGHYRVVEAWPEVLESVPEARLRIIGSGPDEGPLRELAERLGIGVNVEIGAIPGSDRQAMADALGAASLVVLLSDYEAHPVAVMEGVAVGARVLVSRTSGLTELADAGLATGVDHGASRTQVAGAIVAALRTPRPAAPPRLPSWDDCAAELAEIYAEALGRDRADPEVADPDRADPEVADTERADPEARAAGAGGAGG